MTLPKGSLATGIFLALPLLIWFAYQPPSLDLYTAGKVLGVFGFTAFTYALLMSIRIPLQEKIFGDLGNSYSFHQVVGTIALMTLALHPIFLAWTYFSFSPKDAALMLLPIGDFAKTSGVLALYVMTFCIVCTYYVRLPYHIWKKVHAYLALAFLLGSLHSLFIEGDIQLMPALRMLFFLFFILGVGAIGYRVLFKRLFVRRASYVVSSVQTVNDTFVDVTLKPKDKGIAVMPGQFAYVTYPSSNGVKNEEHPFSVAGSRPDGTLRFVTKKLGDFTNTLPNLKVGDEALIEGPYGSFSSTKGGKTQVWIAGGIGITPFLAFAEALPYTNTATLVYAIRNDAENAVAPDLDRLAKEKSNLNIVTWNSEKQGFLTAQSALEGFNIPDVDVFLCGPPGMVTAMRKQLFDLGVPHHHIHQEKFSMLPS